MTCEEWQQQFVLAESQERAPAAARLHLAECADCQKFIGEAERLRAELRNLAESEHAPRVLREKIERVIRGHKASGLRRRSRFGIVAAAVAFLVAVGYGLAWRSTRQSPAPDRLAQEFIRDHLHYLPGREQVFSASAREIERWFQGQVDFPVQVPDVPDAVLEAGRVCMVAGRKAALLHYRHKPDDTLVSLFIVEAPRSVGRQEKLAAFTAQNLGCNAALWFRHGLAYCLVGVLGDDVLSKFGESVRRQQP